MTNTHTAPNSLEDPAASDPIPVKVALPTRPLNLWQSYRTARRNLLELIPERALHQPVLSGRSGPQRWHMIMAPDAIRRVLLDAVEDYPKSVATRAVLQPAIGDRAPRFLRVFSSTPRRYRFEGGRRPLTSGPVGGFVSVAWLFAPGPRGLAA
jgi:hypothetical protein